MSRWNPEPVAVRMWRKVEKTDTCWLWRGSVSRVGYGHVRDGERLVPVHRVAFEEVHGPVPAGLVLDHLCRVRRCVNPAHLEAVTQRTNIVERGMSPTAIAHRTGRCSRGHELHRYEYQSLCLVCVAASQRARRARNPKPPYRGERVYCAKLTEKDVREIRAARAQGVTQKDLAEEYGVTQITVSRVVRRLTWKHVA